MRRDRGRLVDVGITEDRTPWKLFSEKELEVRFSRSYGPGRYDLNYEWGGHDYPIGYVRWTEQRNFQACLHLMSQEAKSISRRSRPNVCRSWKCCRFIRALAAGGTDIGIVLEYPGAEDGSKGELRKRDHCRAGHENRIQILSR